MGLAAALPLRARKAAAPPAKLNPRWLLQPDTGGERCSGGDVTPHCPQAGDHHGKVNGTADAPGYSSARDFGRRIADLLFGRDKDWRSHSSWNARRTADHRCAVGALPDGRKGSYSGETDATTRRPT